MWKSAVSNGTKGEIHMVRAEKGAAGFPAKCEEWQHTSIWSSKDLKGNIDSESCRYCSSHSGVRWKLILSHLALWIVVCVSLWEPARVLEFEPVLRTYDAFYGERIDQTIWFSLIYISIVEVALIASWEVSQQAEPIEA